MLVTRRLEIEAPIMVVLTVLCAGVQTMSLNGKSWVISPYESVGTDLGPQIRVYGR